MHIWIIHSYFGKKLKKKERKKIVTIYFFQALKHQMLTTSCSFIGFICQLYTKYLWG